MNILFTETGWSDYDYWLRHDTGALKKIHNDVSYPSERL